MMNSKLFAHEIAASDLEVVGTSIFESYVREPRSVLFVPASEEIWNLDSDYYASLGQGDSQECYCCCCTGECRQQDEWTEEDERAYQEADARAYDEMSAEDYRFWKDSDAA